MLLGHRRSCLVVVPFAQVAIAPMGGGVVIAPFGGGGVAFVLIALALFVVSRSAFFHEASCSAVAQRASCNDFHGYDRRALRPWSPDEIGPCSTAACTIARLGGSQQLGVDKGCSVSAQGNSNVSQTTGIFRRHGMLSRPNAVVEDCCAAGVWGPRSRVCPQRRVVG